MPKHLTLTEWRAMELRKRVEAGMLLFDAARCIGVSHHTARRLYMAWIYPSWHKGYI